MNRQTDRQRTSAAGVFVWGGGGGFEVGEERELGGWVLGKREGEREGGRGKEGGRGG